MRRPSSRRAAQSGVTCDRDEISIKTEAISALTQMDPATAFPILQGVLAKKDECSVDLRKGAVFVLGRRGDSVAATLLAGAAKSDPSRDVRVSAIGWLPKVQGDAGVNMLEEILRTDTSTQIQRAVVRTLTASDNPRARASMRGLIERKDAVTSLRVAAVEAFNNERASLDDAAFLRTSFGRVDNDQVKYALVNTIGRIGGAENDQWLLALAKNPNEPSQFRSAAVLRLVRQNTSVADLMKLYEISDAQESRLADRELPRGPTRAGRGRQTRGDPPHVHRSKRQGPGAPRARATEGSASSAASAGAAEPGRERQAGLRRISPSPESARNAGASQAL